MWDLLFHLVYLAVLITILVLTILILKKQQKKEDFANCFGAQYNGLPFLDNKTAPVCPRGYTPPYRTGGCAEYDPQQISVDYAEGKKGFIPFV